MTDIVSSAVAGLEAALLVGSAGALLAGIAAGAAHALLGPDHLAAVVPLSLRRGAAAGSVGLRWGLGHALGALLLGVAAVAARDALPWGGLSAWAERAIGALLVLLGLWTLRRASRAVVHVHEHDHDGERHGHAHLHVTAAHAPALTGRPHRHHHAAFGIGLLHGLAGFGHLWSAVPALALPRLAAVAYLTGYGGGTILAMSAFSALVGRLGARTERAGTRMFRALAGGAGTLAVCVGLWWLAAGEN